MKVRIRKFNYHQKIPWVRFAGNDKSNFGLILNRNGARDQKIILMKNFNLFLESAVFKILLQLLILFPANRTQENFWWHSNFLILTFIFKIVDFRTFLSIYSQSGENSFTKTSEKHLFSAHSSVSTSRFSAKIDHLGLIFHI